MFIFSGRGIFAKHQYAPFEMLRYYPPGLLLDVGASNGVFSTMMRSRNPHSKVFAFEPFPGNLPLLHEAVGSDSRVKIFDRAVTNEKGPLPFEVASTVTSQIGIWKAGYSSLGRLVEKPTERTIHVDTIAVDDAIGDESVTFMKIDVQGSELAVLKSAQKALSSRRISSMLVEFSGETDVLQCILDHGFIVFDTRYMMVPKTDDVDKSMWDIEGSVTLSTGREALWAWPRLTPSFPDEYVSFMEIERKKTGYIQTDLSCILPEFAETYFNAAKGLADAF